MGREFSTNTTRTVQQYSYSKNIDRDCDVPCTVLMSSKKLNSWCNRIFVLLKCHEVGGKSRHSPYIFVHFRRVSFPPPLPLSLSSVSPGPSRVTSETRLALLHFKERVYKAPTSGHTGGVTHTPPVPATPPFSTFPILLQCTSLKRERGRGREVRRKGAKKRADARPAVPTDCRFSAFF